MRSTSVKKIFLALVFLFTIIFSLTTRCIETGIDQKYIDKFSLAFMHIKKLYVKDISDEQLFDNAISGMLNNLDPHSRYLDAKDFSDLNRMTNGNFVGLGVEITQDQGIIKVISPIDGTPAQKAGIKPGDYILSVNKISLIDMPINEATQKLTGPAGTSVTIRIVNEQDKKVRTLKIKRKIIDIKSVNYKILEPDFAYIRITRFQADTAKNLNKAINIIENELNHKLKGLVLDLRNNPGGLLNSSVDVANTFLDGNKIGVNKPVVYTKGRVEEAKHIAYVHRGKDKIDNTPMVVLINGGSASASEIVAAALQDYKRAIILGTQSFGKGSVQTVFPLDKKTGIKLTTALYYSPSGYAIQGNGVTPDIVVNDFKMQKTAKGSSEKDKFLWQLRETDLKNYIKTNDKHKNSVIKADNENIAQLASEDYQLYEALKLLKDVRVLTQFQTTKA